MKCMRLLCQATVAPALLSAVAFAASPGDIVITEWMANPDQVLDDAGEYVEIYNTTGSAITMTNWELTDDGSDSATFSGTINAGEFFVIGVSNDLDGAGFAPDAVLTGTYFFGNSGDEIVIKEGSTEIARVNYTNGDPFGSGVAAELNSVANQVNGVTQFSDYVAATDSFGADLGSPGAAGNTSLGIDDPNIALSETSLTLGVAAGSPVTGTITVNNTGPSVALNVTAANFTGDDAAKFSVSGSLPTGIIAGGSDTVTIQFDPGADLGRFEASVELVSNDQNGDTVSVDLVGLAGEALPLSEPFDYSAGDLTAGGGGYYAFSSAGTNAVQVTAGSLSYTGAPAGVGNKAVIAGLSNAEDLAKYSANVSSGALYASFLLNVTQNPTEDTDSEKLVTFNKTAPSGSSFDAGGLRIFSSSAADTNYRLGTSISTNTFGSITGSTTVLNPNTTYYIVMKYEIVAGDNNDVMTVWINPTPGETSEGTGALETITHTNGGSEFDVAAGEVLNGFALKQANSAGDHITEIDAIRLGTTYTSVNPAATSSVGNWALYGN